MYLQKIGSFTFAILMIFHNVQTSFVPTVASVVAHLTAGSDKWKLFFQDYVLKSFSIIGCVCISFKYLFCAIQLFVTEIISEEI